MKLITIPGVIDAHVHLREPGATQKEDMTSGTKAAVSGGVTLVVDMPNNPQPTNSPQALENKVVLAANRIYSDLGFYFAATPEAIPYFTTVKDRVFGYKLYMNHTTGNLIVTDEQAQAIFAKIPEGKTLIVHAEGETMSKAIALAKKFNTKLHIAHVSLASEVHEIKKAKEQGMNITAEVTPHHLFLKSDDVKRLGSYGIMKPPLQTVNDQEVLWEGLRRGIIDIVATDHAPHTIDEKDNGEKPSFGVPGVETMLPLLFTAVAEKRISLETLVTVTNTNPRKIFSIPEQLDTYVEIDASESYVLTNQKVVSKCGWTPFAGMRIKGKIVSIYLRGHKIVDNEKIMIEPTGKLVTPMI